MMAKPEPLPPVSILLADQRRRCRQGEPFHVETLLASHPALRDNPESLLDLIYNEVVLRENRGETPAIHEYQARFPDLAAPLRDLFEVHDALHHDAGEGSTLNPTTKLGASSSPSQTILVTGSDPAPDQGLDDEGHAAYTPGWPALDGYELIDVLGSGGMGVVYMGHDVKRRMPVAVKTIRHVDPVTIYRFKQEFRALLDVAHPNLVSLHELISDGRSWFIVMEYVEGSDFLEYVRRGTSLTSTLEAREGPLTRGAPPGDIDRAPEATLWAEPIDEADTGSNLEVAAPNLSPAAVERLRAGLRQVAEGLDALHRAGKIHRDIKPSNVTGHSSGAGRDHGLRAGDRAGAGRPRPEHRGTASRHGRLHVSGASGGAAGCRRRATGTASA